MSPLGIAAVALYGIVYPFAFVCAVNSIARDEARREPGKTDPAWVNGAVALVAAFFWPVFLIGWLLGRLYVVTARMR